ncbi:hypothetical protein Trydic_g12057 [Trypoxylus dichotomus]
MGKDNELEWKMSWKERQGVNGNRLYEMEKPYSQLVPRWTMARRHKGEGWQELVSGGTRLGGKKRMRHIFRSGCCMQYDNENASRITSWKKV